MPYIENQKRNLSLLFRINFKNYDSSIRYNIGFAVFHWWVIDLVFEYKKINESSSQ